MTIKELANTDKRGQIVKTLVTGYAANLARKTPIKDLNLTVSFLAGGISADEFYDQVIKLGYTQEDLERFAVELVTGEV
jgi:hypothetical protein